MRSDHRIARAVSPRVAVERGPARQPEAPAVSTYLEKGSAPGLWLARSTGNACRTESPQRSGISGRLLLSHLRALCAPGREQTRRSSRSFAGLLPAIDP